jgi:hypothetical protein
MEVPLTTHEEVLFHISVFKIINEHMGCLTVIEVIGQPDWGQLLNGY